MRDRHVLVLAGSREARLLLERARGLPVVASLAGRTEDPADLGVPVRIGGFGGEGGFRKALERATAVLDATHPFALAMTGRAVRICAEMGVPYLRLSRPPFEVDGVRHSSATACAEALPAGARVLVTCGPGSLAAFEGRGLDLVCRRVDPAPPRAGVIWEIGIPPFALKDEIDLMRWHRITHLVTKDSGGARDKLDAALELGLSIHVIDRPAHLGGEETHDIDAALAFLWRHAPAPADRDA